MGKQVVPQLAGDAHRGLGGEVLGCDGTHQANDAQGSHHQAHPSDVAPVRIGDAHVNDGGHHQGHHQFEGSLQQLKQRTQDTFFLVRFHVAEELFHRDRPFTVIDKLSIP